MFLPLGHNLIAISFDLCTFATVDNSISCSFPKVLRVFPYPLNRLHKSLVDVAVINFFNISKGNENTTGGFSNGISDMMRATSALKDHRPTKWEDLIAIST
ncbi:hypothetical protein AI2744V1_3315 [Klebsiella oxytoca]|nr:hypothetical protein AI2744V1_3315 [Klebsiella oxytoca]CAH5275337.1 hypothetical protein AI2744V1_3315 [Klebsiella oxytoca]